MSLLDQLRESSDTEQFPGRLLHGLDRILPSSGLPPQSRVPPSRAPKQPVRQHSVSVVIPCFNYGHFLSESVASALTQADVDIEVLIVDDASTDDSLTVAQRLAAADSRIRVLRHRHNAGHVVSFNTGFAESSGEFIVRLDADDLLTPGSLARAVALFEVFPQVGLVYGHPRHFSTVTPPAARTQSQGWTIWSGRDWVAERCRVGCNCITTPEAMVRAKVMRRIGALRTELRFAQDMEMWLRVAAVADVGRVNGCDQALHRDHPTSMSATVGSGILIDLEERHRVFDLLFTGVGGGLDGATVLHERANRVLATSALDSICRAYERGRAAAYPTDDLIQFARSICPEIEELPAWNRLQMRLALGERWSSVVFLPTTVSRRVREERYHLHWRYTGL